MSTWGIFLGKGGAKNSTLRQGFILHKECHLQMAWGGKEAGLKKKGKKKEKRIGGGDGRENRGIRKTRRSLIGTTALEEEIKEGEWDVSVGNAHISLKAEGTKKVSQLKTILHQGYTPGERSV